MNTNRSDTGVLLGCLCALGCELMFGLSYLFTKDATGTASPLALLGWRFAVAALTIGGCAAVGLVKLRLRGKSLKPLLRVALCSPIAYFVGETYGIRLTTAAESGAFLACIPVASIVASALLLKKKPTRRQVVGILITFAGVLVAVLAAGIEARLSVVGYAMLVLAMAAYALYGVSVEKARDFSGAEVTFAMLMTGAVVFAPAAVAEAVAEGTLPALLALPFRDAGFARAVLYLGVGSSVFAFFLSNVALARIGVNRTSSFIGVATAVAILAGMFILHEPFSPLQLVGAAMIVCGVYVANSGKNQLNG